MSLADLLQALGPRTLHRNPKALCSPLQPSALGQTPFILKLFRAFHHRGHGIT